MLRDGAGRAELLSQLLRTMKAKPDGVGNSESVVTGGALSSVTADNVRFFTLSFSALTNATRLVHVYTDGDNNEPR
jgi:hypothetical protein